MTKSIIQNAQHKLGDTFMLDGVEVTIVRTSQPKQLIFNKYKWIADALKRGHDNYYIEKMLKSYDLMHGQVAPAGSDYPEWCDEE